MPDLISDATLGNRFWTVGDLMPLEQAQPALAATEGKSVKHDSTVISFVNAGGDTMARSAINKAELFAASHILNAEQQQLEADKSARNISVLIGGSEAVDDFVDKAAQTFMHRNPGVSEADAKAVCSKALNKLMASDEFDTRAKAQIPGGGPDASRALGPLGLASAKNAVLGLAQMLKDGQISENAVLVLANGNYYDASNRTDLLKLTAASASKVKELFVAEERYKALVQQCKDKYREIEGSLSQEQKTKIEGDIAIMEQRMNDVIAKRKAATQCIKTDYLLSDPTKEVSSDAKFQEKQLDEIRDSLRAFRYDIDRARGTSMGMMERMRRGADDLRSSVTEHRVTKAQYDGIKAADDMFNTSLLNLRGQLFGHMDLPQPKHQGGDIYEKVSADVGLGDVICTDDMAKAATDFSHLTNDRIRYHYSGVESLEAKNYKAINDELGSIARSGGKRTVTLHMGVDAMFKIGLFGVDAKAKAGGSADVKATISVDNSKGTVSVTYYVGGKVGGSASITAGIDPDGKVSKPGIGAKASVSASGGGGYAVTKTYANFEEFAKTISKQNILMTPRPREAFLAWGKAALKGIGHCFVLGATVTGFRIHRSNMDQAAYSATLRNRNIFGEMGGVFLKKRNVELVGERKTVSIDGSLKGSVKGGVYVIPNATGKFDSILDGSISDSLTGSKEISVHGKLYQSFAKTLNVCSQQFLQTRFDTDAAEMDGTWKDDLVGIVASGADGNATGIAESISMLDKKLTELEESVLGSEKKDDAFWHDFAAKAKLLAVATALLTKRAEALDEAAEGAATAKTAAKAAGEYIIPRLANPVVKIPSKIYNEEFFNVFDVATPRTATTVFSAKVSYDAFSKPIEGFLNGVKGGAGTISKPVVDVARDTIGLSGTFEYRLTSEKVVSKHVDKRPWLQKGKKSVEIRLPATAPLRVVVDHIARQYIKNKGGHDQLEESKWVKEFEDGLIDSLKLAAGDVAIESTVPLLEMSLGDLEKWNPSVRKLLAGVKDLKDFRDESYAFNDDSFKTIRLDFDSEWRFSSIKLSEDYDSEAKLEIAPEYVSVDLSLSSATSVTDWSMLPRPKPNDLMKRAADYKLAGNTEGFVNCLNRSKKGVLRLLEAGQTGAPNRPDDIYWHDDVRTMQHTMDECTQLLDTLAAGDSTVAEQAKALRGSFAQLVASVRTPQPNQEADARLRLAANFFTMAAQIYTLAEMAEHA
ncbi:MAG: hypothetical protein J5746_06935 [Victivallales bacterium]|nr:hypothetical protein [Victivallales bacterium]